MANLYGKTSQMRIETKFKDNKTYMSDVFYTPSSATPWLAPIAPFALLATDRL